MKKQNVLTWGLIAGVLVISVLFLTQFKSWQTKIENFSLEEYQTYIDQFSSDLMVGAVETKEEAIDIAKEIWIDVYGKNVRFKKPYKVFYDADSEVWLVQGSLPFYLDGGVPYILIEKESGRVLAVWHDK